jgi:hypothetical protein
VVRITPFYGTKYEHWYPVKQLQESWIGQPLETIKSVAPLTRSNLVTILDTSEEPKSQKYKSRKQSTIFFR